MACNVGWVRSKLYSRPIKIRSEKNVKSDYETFLISIRSLEFVIDTWKLKIFKWEEGVYINESVV